MKHILDFLPRSIRIPLSVVVAATILVAGAGPLAAQEQADEPLTAIRAARLLDVRNQKVVNDPVVLIAGDRIKAVGSNIEIPPGTKVVDLPGSTLLPGLIDSHVHLIGGGGAGFGQRTISRDVLAGAANARLVLEAGFTTIRNMGGGEFSGIALRDAIADGDIAGPRILDAGGLIAVTGGHCSGPVLRPGIEFSTPTVSDSADGFAHVTRDLIRRGADFIKVCITGGFMSGTDPNVVQFREEELRTIVEIAKAHGKKIALHAHGADGIKLAARLGVSSVEHASLIDDEGIRLLKESDTYIVPTVAIGDFIPELAERNGRTPEIVEQLKATQATQRANLARAAKAGVPFAFGTDAPVLPYGQNGKEFAALVNLGLPPWQAIVSATVNASRLLGIESKVGSIEPGKFADIIAVGEDPLQDITALERVTWVMKGGIVVHLADAAPPPSVQ